MTPKNRPLYRVVGDPLIRLPLLSVSVVDEINHSHSQFDVALLNSLFAIPEFALAVEIASPSLAEAAKSFENNLSGDVAKVEPVSRKLYRYLLRSAHRATPFGLFAAVGFGTWGTPQRPLLASKAISIWSRPDLGCLYGMVEQLERSKKTRESLSWVVSQPTYSLGSRELHFSNDTEAGQPAKYSIQRTRVVESVFQKAKEPIGFCDLAAYLSESFDVDGMTSTSFLHQLIDLGFLQSSLRPVVAEKSGIGGGLRGYGFSESQRSELARLADIDHSILCSTMSLSNSNVDACVSMLRAQRERLSSYSDAFKSTVQVDSTFDADAAMLPDRVADLAAEAASLLVSMAPSSRVHPRLVKYHDLYSQLYNDGEEVPLLDFLNPERVELLSSVSEESRQLGGEELGRHRYDTLRRIILSSHESCRLEYELSRGDVAELSSDSQELPAPQHLDISFQLLSESVQALSEGEFRLLVSRFQGVNGAGRMSGRFSWVLGQSHQRFMGSLAEQNPKSRDRITAEISYLPRDSRMLNVSARVHNSEYEICEGVTPSVDASRNIPMKELLIGRDERGFYLRWSRTGVIVDITTSHMLNYEIFAPPVSRFLSYVGSEGCKHLSPFDWGGLVSYPSLPRIVYGDVILSPAMWCDSRQLWQARNESIQAFEDCVARWRESNNVPRNVLLPNGDQGLSVDLTRKLDLRLFQEAVRLADVPFATTVVEDVGAEASGWLGDSTGRSHRCEIVVSAVNISGQSRNASGESRSPAPSGSIARCLDSLDDFCYLKLYGPLECQDESLVRLVNAVDCERLIRWFFVRYEDPLPHLRVRFFFKDSRCKSLSLRSLEIELRKQRQEGILERVVFDTYRREIERYGGDEGIVLCEGLWGEESAYMLAALSQMDFVGVSREQACFYSLAVLAVALSAGHAQAIETLSVAVPLKRGSSRTRTWLEKSDVDCVRCYLACAEATATFEKLLSLGESFFSLARSTIAGVGQTWSTEVRLSLLHMHINRWVGTDRKKELEFLSAVRESLVSAMAWQRNPW